MSTVKAIKSVNNFSQIELICEDVMGNEWGFVVSKIDHKNWVNGMLIQNAFPYLSAGDREMILTGISDELWNKMFEYE